MNFKSKKYRKNTCTKTVIIYYASIKIKIYGHNNKTISMAKTQWGNN